MLPDVDDILRLCGRIREDFGIEEGVDESSVVLAMADVRTLCLAERDAPAVVFYAFAMRPHELRGWCAILADDLPRYVAYRLGQKVLASADELSALREAIQHGRVGLDGVLQWFAPRLRPRAN